MGRFFPVSSVKVGNIHSNGSGFVDIANNSKADEEMTSNDTVLVSNETETDIFANETTPQYVLMSQPLLTLNDSRSVLGGKSTFAHLESSRAVKKTVLLSRAVEGTKTRTLATVAPTVTVNTSKLTSLKTQSLERLKTLKVLSSNPSPTVNNETVESVMEISITTSSQLQSQPLQVPSTDVLHYSEQIQISSVQESAVVMNGSFNIESIGVESESKDLKSLSLQSQFSKLLNTSSAVTLQNSKNVQVSWISASPLVGSDFSSSAILNLNSPLKTPQITEKILSPSQDKLETLDSASSNSRLDNYNTLEASAVEKSRGSERAPQAIFSVRSSIPISIEFSSVVISQYEYENKAFLSSNTLERLLPATHGPLASLPFSGDVDSPTSIFSWRTVSRSPSLSLSNVETPTSVEYITGNHVQSLSLATQSEQHQTLTPEETKYVTEDLAAHSFVFSTKEIATSSINDTRASASLNVIQNNKTVAGSPTTILESGKPGNNANWQDTGDSTFQTGEDKYSSSAPSELLKLSQNVYRARTFSFVLPTPSATVRATRKEPVNIKASSSLDNTQSTWFPGIQEERDEIPVVTPRLAGLPSLSDVSPSETHSSTSFVDSNNSEVLQEDKEKSVVSSTATTFGTVVAMALSSQTPTESEQLTLPTENIHALDFSSLLPEKSESHGAITETITSMVLSIPELVQNAQRSAHVISITTSLEADSNSKMAPLAVGANNTKRSEVTDVPLQSKQQISSFKSKLSLTVVTSDSPSLASCQLWPLLSTTLASYTQQGVPASMSAMATSKSFTPLKQENYDVMPAAMKNIVTLVPSPEVIQARSATNSQRGFAAELPFSEKWSVESTPNVPRNQSSTTTSSMKTNASSSSGVSQKQYISKPTLLGSSSEAQISTNAVILTSSVPNIMEVGQSDSEASIYHHNASTASSTRIKASLTSSRSQMFNSTGSAKQGFSEFHTQQTETMPLSLSRLVNTPSAESHSVLVSFGSTISQNGIAVSATNRSNVYDDNAPFSKTVKENISSSILAGVIKSLSSGEIVTGSVTITPTPVPQTLEDTLGKLHVQEKEKVVRTLASGIVASPVFHHVVRHIGELLKNETGLVHSVSRLESMLGHLQGLFVRETRNHLRSLSNVSLPLAETAKKINNSDEISKQVDLKLDGISAKLKRISSVLTELQIKRRENNSTVVTKSDIGRPGNFTSVDEKHNRLIELLLKRFNKLEAVMQRKREFVTANTSRTKGIASVRSSNNTKAIVVQHKLPEGSSSMVQSELKAFRFSSVIVPSSNAAIARSFSHLSTQRIKTSTNVRLNSKPFLMHHMPIRMRSTISQSSTTTGTSLNSLQARQVNTFSISGSSSGSQSTLISSSLLSREVITSLSNILPTGITTSISTPALPLVREMSSVFSKAQNNATVSTVARPLLPTSKVTAASSVSSDSQLDSDHHRKNKTRHVARSKEFTYVTFRNGLEAGVFTERGKVKNMESCVEQCYSHSSCHVAFMVGNTCYSIHCYSQKTCEVLPIQTPIITTRVVYLKDRMLKLPFSTTMQHKTSPLAADDRNFTIKNCAKNITILKNMTFLAGMSAGNYTDYGTVGSIQACSNICCSKKVCDAAFMILNNCFTIDCISDKACHAIPSKSHKVNTSIVYFRKTLSTKRFQQMPIRVPKVTTNQQFCPLLGGVLEGVTFNGGINAGNFTDHGLVEEFSSCIEKCCSSQTCDVSFMVEKNCYSVKCAMNKRRCLPIIARSTEIKTFMAVKKTRYFSNFTIPTANNSRCAQKGPIQRNFTFRRGMKAGNFTEHGKVMNMNSCIQHCCTSASCSVAFMIRKHCYSVACSSKRDCETVLVKNTNFNTAIAFVNREEKSLNAGKTESKHIPVFTKSILGGNCDVTDVQHNVNITGGWKAGKFLRIPDIKDMRKCTEACCDYHGCGAAMFIDQYCYNLICFKQTGCQLIGSKEAFMIDKFVAVRKNLGHVMSPFKKAQIAMLTTTKEHVNHSFFMEDVQQANKIRNQSAIYKSMKPENTGNSDNAKTLSHNVIGSKSINPTRTQFTTNSESLHGTVVNLSAKKNEIPFLTSSQHKSLSLIPSLLQTPYSSVKSSPSRFHNSLSVGVSQTSSVFVKEQLTNIQEKEQGGKENSRNPLPAFPLIFKDSSSSTSREDNLSRQTPSIGIPLGTSKNQTETTSISTSSNNELNGAVVTPEGYSFKSDYSLLKEETTHNRKRTYACTHTFVFNNATLRGGLKAGDVKNEGKVEGMEECVETCCKTPECNVAMLLKDNCYIVACSNKKSCEAVPTKQTRGNKVAYVARSKDETELIKQLISHTETLKTDSLDANKTKVDQPARSKDLQAAGVAIRQGSCFRSPVLRNVRFKLGKHAGDFKSVGKVKNVNRCVALCCKEDACNAIFMLGSRCHLVSCSNAQDCQTAEAKSEFYKPTVVYLARNKAEIAYFLKLIPKKLLDKYGGNATASVTATIDQDEPAIRRSQLERAKGNDSIDSLYSKTTSTNVIVGSIPTPELTNVVSTQQEVAASLSSMSVTASPSPGLQSSNIVPTQRLIATSLTDVSVAATSIPSVESKNVSSDVHIIAPLGSVKVTATSPATMESTEALLDPSASFSRVHFPAAKEPTKSLSGKHVAATLNPNMEPETTSVLNGLRSSVFTSNITLTTVKVKKKQSRRSKEEKSTLAQASMTSIPFTKSAVQSQLTMAVINFTESTVTSNPVSDVTTRADVSQIKLSVIQSVARNTRSSAGLAGKVSGAHKTFDRSNSVKMIAPAEVSKKEDSDKMSTKAEKAPSLRIFHSLAFVSINHNFTGTVAPSLMSPRHVNAQSSTSPALTDVEPSTTTLTRQMSTAPPLGDFRMLTAAHQQTGSINQPRSLISHTASTVKFVSSNLSPGILSNIKSILTGSSLPITPQGNNSNDLTSIKNRNLSTESTQRQLHNEHKRGDIALLSPSAFQKSRIQQDSRIPPSSVVPHLNGKPVARKQQLTAVNQATTSPVSSGFESSLLPTSTNSDKASIADTALRGAFDTKDMVMARSALDEPLHIQPSPTTRIRKRSPMGLILLRESLSPKVRSRDISASGSPVSTTSKDISERRSPEVGIPPERFALEKMRTKSAYAPPSAQGMKVTTVSTLSGLKTGRRKTTLARTSNQSVFKMTPTSSVILSTSPHLMNVGVKLTSAKGPSLPRGTYTFENMRAHPVTVPHILYTSDSPNYSRNKKHPSLSKGTTDTKGKLSSITKSKPPLRTTKRTLLGVFGTLSLVTSSLHLNSHAASMSTARSGGNSRLSLTLQPYSSTTAKIIGKTSIVPASLPQGVLYSQYSNNDASTLNNSSRKHLETVSATPSRRINTSLLNIETASPTKTEGHVTTKTELLASSASKLPHHSKEIETFLEGNSSETFLRWKHNQTSSSLQKVQDRLQSLQGYLSNIASKRKAALRNKTNQESAKQNNSQSSYEGHQVQKILKELSLNPPNIPLIEALNHSVLRLVFNKSGNVSDFIRVKLLLNDIQKILTPITSKSVTSKSSLNDKNLFHAHPQSITKGDVAYSQFSHFLSVATRIPNSSSIEDKEKRVEIPFAGRLLEQIKILRYSSTFKQHEPTESAPDSTPISGGQVEQIRRLHASPRVHFDNNSGNPWQTAIDLASSITQQSSRTGNTFRTDKTPNFQSTVALTMSVKSAYQILPPFTSNTKSSANYASTPARDMHSKSPKPEKQISHSKTSRVFQSTPSLLKKDLGERTSPLRKTGTVTVSKTNPSIVVNQVGTVHSKMGTPALTSTPSLKRLQSYTFVQGRKALSKKSSSTVKGTIDHSVKMSSPSMATESSFTEKTGHDEKAGMFGYFAQLLKSIKDILTKKNSKPGETSSARLPSSGAIPFFQRITTATSVSSNLSSALQTPIVIQGTLRRSRVTPVASSIISATASFLQPMATRALDMSLAMQPLHQVALNITGIRKAALCEHSPSHENSTMRGGIHSGVFKEVGTVSGDAECISHCCVSNSCDAAFLLSNRCFLVSCKSKTLCQSVPAKNLAFRPRVVYIENRTALARGQKKPLKPLNSDIQPENALSISRFSTLNTPQLKSHNSEAVCAESVIRQNVTLRGGIKSGHFKDQGTVESIQKCIELCCSAGNCSVAFMLLNRCFLVSCYNETSCSSIPARSLIFQPQLAYIKRNFTSKATLNSHLQVMKISKTRLTAEASSKSNKLTRTGGKKTLDGFHDNCRYNIPEKDVTLRGGLNAGSFLDSGVVNNISACVDNCCHATKCDVAFMIMKRCFLVTCYSSSLCQSVPARNLDYLTEMVHVERDETAVVRDLLARLVQPSPPTVMLKSVLTSSVVTSTDHRNLPDFSSTLHLHGTTGGAKDNQLSLISYSPVFHSGSSLPSTPPAVPVDRALIKSAIAPLNVNKQENVGLIQTIGMSTRLKSTRHALDQIITPSSLRIYPTSSSSQSSASIGNVSIQRQELESGTSSKDERCQSTDVYYNATMRGGINAGVFKDQGPVQNMRKCIEQCCRWQFCSVAFMLLTRCYIIACYNDHLCDPVPARNVTFTPRVAYISRVRRDQGNVSNVLETNPTPTLLALKKSRLKTSTVDTNVTAAKAYLHTATFFPSTVTPFAQTLPRSLAIKPSPSQSAFTKVFTSRPESRHNCTNSEQKHNVTLRGGLSAGHFKDRGKVTGMQECVDFCCKEDRCNVALMLLENCFTVICHNKSLCESVPAKTGRYRSRIVYVGRTRSPKSAHPLTHKLTKTISLLNAALPAMGGTNNSETSQSGGKATLSEQIRGFDSKQPTELLTPSLSVEEIGQRSNILNVGDLTNAKHSTNQSGTNKKHQSLIVQDNLHKIAKNSSLNASASQQKHYHLMSTSVSSGHNNSLLSSSTIGLKASRLAISEPNKSAIERDAKSRHKSGLASTFGNPSQHSLPQPSSCLNSPISYNVTLRNGIRSGYFRDQGRVENMGVCIQKCCGAEDCDVAFLLKQRCYLVTCYTKKGCQTVPARHSLFRPRVSHVQRTNVSQLMSFMDEQEDAYSSEKTVSVQPRSSVQSDYITPSSTLPALVNSLDNSRKHNTKAKVSPASKAQASRALHDRAKHRKIKTGKRKRTSGKHTMRETLLHVTVAPELKKRKARKSKKSRHSKNRHKLKNAKSESSKLKIHHFKDKLIKKTDEKLSHSDLDRLFQLMKPKQRVGSPPSSAEDKLQTETVSRHNYRASVKGKEAAILHQQSPASSMYGTTATPSLAAVRMHPKKHKSQKKAKGQNDFDTQVKALLEKEDHSNKNTLSNGVEPTKKLNSRRTTATKEKITYTATKHFLDYVKKPTGTTPRPTTRTAATSRLITAIKPTIRKRKGSSHHRSKYRATKSTVPSLPTQAPDVEVSRCTTGLVEYNQTLRGGLSSGLFHEVGRVNDIEGCSHHCCLSPICDLAFMVLNHCFLVTCSSSNPHMCESTPALATKFNPMISRVSRRGSEVSEDQSTTTASDRESKPVPTVRPLASPSRLPKQVSEVETSIAVNNVTNQSTSGNPVFPPTTSNDTKHKSLEARAGDTASNYTEMSASPPGCISSLTERNVTLRGGLHAGKFTDAGKVNGSYTCTELCCKADSCDVAFFAFHRCFLVKCFDEYLCTSTPSLLPKFNPTVVHVYRHHSKPTPKPTTTLPPISDVLQEIEAETQTKSKHKNKTCAHSEVYDEVTLRQGYKAGNFTSHGKVNSTNQCVDFCCKQPGCDLIFMFLNNCFTVSCFSGFACEIVPARQSRFKPKVVYFIKNNSSRVIKPSEFNSSLSDPETFEGVRPVNAVHYKELRSKKKNGDSYKKDFSQMNNDTETVDEEFVQVPDNKITSRTVINSLGNVSSQHLKHNVSDRLVLNSSLHSKKHKLKLKTHGLIAHKESKTDEKMDLVLSKLTNVTEENKRLEGELHVLMAKRNKRRHKKKAASSGSTEGEHSQKKQNNSAKNIRKKATYTSKRRMNKLGVSGDGSGMESSARKRVVIVDTDRPPVFPPTDEHKIEEHSIHAFQTKMNQKKHHLKATGKSKLKQRPVKKEHNYSKAKSKHWDPTNEHDIEEHSIYNSTDASGHGKERIKNPRVRVEEGSEIKYGQPEEDKDDLELDEILNLNPNNKTAKETMKPVWINSRNKNEDDLESFHEQLTPTHASHFHVDTQKDKQDIEDAFRMENQKQEKPSEKNVWISSSYKNPDHLGSFHEQISPTHRLPFGFNNQRGKEHTSEDEFHIEHHEQPKPSAKYMWTSTKSRNRDHMENFREQKAPSDKPYFQLNKGRVHQDTEEDDFNINREDKAEDSETPVWISSKNRNGDILESFHEQIAPTHKLPFQSEKKNENTQDDEFNAEHQDEPNASEEQVWKSSRDRNKDHLKNFGDQIEPTHRSQFQLDKQSENQVPQEDEFHIKNHDEQKDSEKQVWESLRNRNKDHKERFDEQITPAHRSRFQTDSQGNNEDSSKNKVNIVEHQHQPFLHEVARNEADFLYDNEHREISTQHFANSARKEPETMSEFDELDKDMDTSRREHSIERPVFGKNDFRNVPNARDENKIHIDAVKASEEIAVKEKPLNVSTTSSTTEHSRNYSHEKPDFDAIYNKINNIYNRLQHLFEAQSRRERNTTQSTLKKQGGLNSRRREEGIPTPPVSARPTTRSSKTTPPTQKARVVKQYVTDNFSGSGVPSHRHRDALMDYIKTIYNRVQVLYKRKLKRPPLRARTGHRKATFRHVMTYADGKRQRKTEKERSNSKKANKHHRKNIEEKAVLREMKWIYKNMKKMYHQQWKAQKKAEMRDEKSEGQRQRSYIPASYSARKSNGLTTLPVASARPTGLVTTIERPISLTSSIKGAQIKPQVHDTGEYP